MPSFFFSLVQIEDVCHIGYILREKTVIACILNQICMNETGVNTVLD